MLTTLGRSALIATAAFAVSSMSNLSAASALSGKVVVDGSSTVYPVTEAAAAAFRHVYPKVNVTVAVSGTGGGMKRFAKGETDISNASRPIKAKEIKPCKENGVSFIELPVALDGLSVVINKENTWARTMTVDQLKKIYLAKEQANGAVKWSDLNAEWPAETVKVYSPGTDSGTYDYWKEVMIGKSKESFRSDMSTSEDDNVLVTGVSGDKYAIGYFGAAYYFENKDKIAAAAIVNPKTGKAVLPEPANVIDGSYAPLSRPLFIYVAEKSLRKPAVKKFVEYYLENDDKFATEVGYVAVPKSISDAAAANLKSKATGTHFTTAEGEKRKGGLTALYKAENLVK